MNESPLLQSLFRYKAWANDGLLAELGRLDAEAHAQVLHEATRLLNHTYVVDRIFAAHLSGTPNPYTATNTTETPALRHLRDLIAESDRWYVDYVTRLRSDRLEEPVRFVFTDGLAGCMNRAEILGHVITHGNYHRGSVGQMLKAIDVKPPRDSLTVFLHATEPARRDRP